MELNDTAFFPASFAVKKSFSHNVATSLLYSFLFSIPNELPIGLIRPDKKSHVSLFPSKAPTHFKFNFSKYLLYHLIKLLSQNV
jgi:hypothetical protein